MLYTFSAKNILILEQLHGNTVIDADLITNFDNKPQADAAVTTRKDLVLAIQTADCCPILLTNQEGTIIGTAHCGWRSSKANIILNLVKQMQKKGANDLSAIVGPTIQQYSYEVDQNFFEDFFKDDPQYAQFFISSTKPEHYMFDLPALVIHKLHEAGVTNIINMNEDTYSTPQKYPSYRRDCHLGEHGRVENILSTIVIKN